MNQHPHDPYRNEPGPENVDAPRGLDSAPTDPYAQHQAPAADTAGPQSPAPAYAAAPSAGAPQDAGYGSSSQNAYGAGAQGAQPGGQQAPRSNDVPPAGIKGVYEGPLSGEPTSESDSRLWSMFSQLAVVLGHALSWGFLGWVGPLIIFLVYKDRDRFIRFHAAEALNGAIAVVIVQVVLGVALSIFGVITLGFGFALFPLVGIPALVQLIFSIIGAVKANKGEWWNYPVNIRLVK